MQTNQEPVCTHGWIHWTYCPECTKGAAAVTLTAWAVGDDQLIKTETWGVGTVTFSSGAQEVRFESEPGWNGPVVRFVNTCDFSESDRASLKVGAKVEYLEALTQSRGGQRRHVWAWRVVQLAIDAGPPPHWTDDR